MGGEDHQEDEVRGRRSPGIFYIQGNLQELPQRAKKNSASSADLETAITKSGYGKFNLALLLLSLPAACTNGFVTGSMSFVLPAAAVDLNLSPTGKALLQSAGYAGMISSGFLWGSLSDAFGRKKLLVFGYFMDCIMNILTGAFPVLPSMLVFKYLSGFMICGPFSIFTTYISEVFLSTRRDVAVLAFGVCSALGQVILAGLALLIIPSEVPVMIPLKSWQLFQISCCIPSLISGLAFLFCVESPKFLAEKGDKEGALKVCRTIYKINTGKPSSTYPVKRLKHISREDCKSNFGKLLDGLSIFRTPFIQKAIIIFMIHLAVVGSQNTIRLWLPELLTLVKASELDSDLGICPLLFEGNLGRSNSTTIKDFSGAYQVFADMMLVNTGCALGHFLCLFVVNYIGKRRMMLCSALAAGTCALIMPLINADNVYIPASIFLSFYNLSVFCNINIVVEVFPTRIRATSVSLLMLVARIGILAVNFLAANLIYSHCNYFFYGLVLVSLFISAMTLFIPKHPVEDLTTSRTKESDEVNQ